MSVGVRSAGETAHRVVYCAAVGLAVATVIAAFHETAADIVTTWYRSSTFNHAFLIIPICIYLAWQKRDEGTGVELVPTVWGIAAVVMASFAWLLGRVTGTLVVQEIALVGILEGVILAMCGWAICRVFAFPLLYLFFAVPMGEALVPPLQAETARLAVGLLQVAGVPVFADGNVITIPTGTFQVAEECSGVRFLIASIALGTLFAGLAYRSWWRRAIFLILSSIVPILANGIRAFGIIFIAYVSNSQFAIGIDHIVYGWIFFTAISFVTLGLGMAMREKDGPPSSNAALHPIPIARAQSMTRILVFGFLAITPVFAAQAYADRIDRHTNERSVQLDVPVPVQPWRKANGVQDPLVPLFASPDTQADAAYEANGATVYLHIGYYIRERRGAEVASFEQRLVHDKRWILTATGKRAARLGDKGISVQFMHVASGQKTRTIWYWYWVDGRFTGDPYMAKLLQAKAKLFAGQQAAAIIEAAFDSDTGPEEAEKSLGSFLASLHDLAHTLSPG